MSNSNPVTIVLDLDSETGAKFAAPLVTTIRAAVNGERKYAAYVEAYGVTRENVAEHARALAVAAYPNDEPVQTKRESDGSKPRTRFGNAVQQAGAGLRRALPAEETATETDWLRLVKQAADNAHSKGEFSPETIMAAVAETLTATETDAA